MTRKIQAFCLPLALLFLAGLAVPGRAAALTKCEMSYTAKEWSAIYKVLKGRGTITCDNGETAQVRIEAHGGGLTAGKAEIRDGKGTFSEVSGIKELFGSYAAAGAEAGAIKSGEALALTKGEVSLGLHGTGSGWQVGVSLDKVTISPRE